MNWYKFDINAFDTKVYNEFFGLLTKERKEYVLSLKNEKDRKLTIAGEMLAKKAIAQMYKTAYRNVIIKKEQSGKPVAENFDINLSISHSGDFAVCALDTKPIGIDIEKIRDVTLKTASRFCNKEELDYIFAPEGDSILRFFRVWTAKEAEFKRSGENFKKIDTLSINKSYYEIPGYLICISYT